MFLRERLLSLLARRGPCVGGDLIRELGISQPTFSRLVASLSGRVLALGQTRNRRYALAREIAGVRQPITLYEVRPAGEGVLRFGEMFAVGDRGFAVVTPGDVSYFDDLPWFLNTARPSGFLGRLAPRRHPDLALPDDIRIWSADHVLRFACRHGWDLPGAFIIGDDACGLYLRQSGHPENVVDSSERYTRYPEVVADLLSFGSAGSSAAGEQPKFLATRMDGDRMTPVLVKYSPLTDESAGRRVADLLVAEHIALDTLQAGGFAVPPSCVLTAGGRVFLEIERFDRDGAVHRIGQVTLEVLDAEFAGTDLTGWAESTGVLAARGVIPAEIVARVRWLWTFGRLIGNTDMHFGNLSFLMDRLRVTSLAPVYDMVPMHYHPGNGEVPSWDYKLSIPGPEAAEVAGSAIAAAIEFWGRVAADTGISAGFREIAARNGTRLTDLRNQVEALPVISG